LKERTHFQDSLAALKNAIKQKLNLSNFQTNRSYYPKKGKS